MSEVPVVAMRDIRKSFDTIPVLKGVDFTVKRGEVHALAGENGAGKSTLMKILQGVYQADSGSIEIDGRQVSLRTPHDARDAGIGMVFQEFSLIPTLTVAQNILLTHEERDGLGLINDRAGARRATEILARLGVEIDPNAPMHRLGTAYWQLTEIAKALAQDARVLIMDEPTASLAKHEADQLFGLVRRLTSEGLGIVYISHRMDEFYRVADRITVLRDGDRVMDQALSSVSPAQIVEAIVGRRLDSTLEWQPREMPPGDVLLSVRDITSGKRVRGVTFDLRAGEVLGLAGLMGSGRTEVARCLFGLDRIDSGEILLRGQPVKLRGASSAINEGLALVPEDRRAQGLVLDHSVSDNLLLPLLKQVSDGPFVNKREGRSLVDLLIERFSIRVTDPTKPVRRLSGGNQQKVVLAKWLGVDPEVLILDEPTAGVDIGTKSEIVTMIRSLADQGKAVLLISSELPELLAVSDRVAVINDGRITHDIPRGDIRDEEELQLAVQGV